MKSKALGYASVAVAMRAIPAFARRSFAMFDAERQITLQRKGIMCSFSGVPTSSARRHCWWPAFFILVQLALWTTSACAQSPASTIEEFGLFGTWANDCTTPPSPTNQYTLFLIDLSRER